MLSRCLIVARIAILFVLPDPADYDVFCVWSRIFAVARLGVAIWFLRSLLESLLVCVAWFGALFSLSFVAP